MIGIPSAISSRDRALGTGISAVSAVPPNRRQIDPHGDMPSDAHRRRHALGRLQLEPMPLAIVDRKAHGCRKALGGGNRRHRGRIQSAGQKNYCGYWHGFERLPELIVIVSPTSSRQSIMPKYAITRKGAACVRPPRPSPLVPRDIPSWKPSKTNIRRPRLFDRNRLPGVTSVCPKTGQPDFGTLTITYMPDRRCVELKSLKLYLQQFRNEGIFYEHATNRILDDLVAAIQPRRITLVAEFTPRGGISTKVTARYEASR